MVNRQKQKGTRREYEMRDWFKELGLRCKRVILSGALGGKFSGDLDLFLPKQRKPIVRVASGQTLGKAWEPPRVTILCCY